MAVAALGLDFGAVDIGWNRSTRRATVYEVNTAPYVEGTTAKMYAEAIVDFITHNVLVRTGD
jgi:glutathione synthase/RimK-type ligase-like ATP-grasp enzyme